MHRFINDSCVIADHIDKFSWRTSKFLLAKPATEYNLNYTKNDNYQLSVYEYSIDRIVIKQTLFYINRPFTTQNNNIPITKPNIDEKTFCNS